MGAAQPTTKSAASRSFASAKSVQWMVMTGRRPGSLSHLTPSDKSWALTKRCTVSRSLRLSSNAAASPLRRSRCGAGT
ncbi:hypothetical protein QEG98_33630 [Myxococcus sp. MxC21-1]|uniref:hypothetical protein n=1 Tax=Myxococcus sp. MxC21-1 TaxID=3041439 RepID=UPI00292E5C11|nr:hypothetical protein [Myxococcus sp. MxC21-1]WNZ60833.1 hypothetical protein QEG98_33630 [Myxococcus sp. MxC21-1]